MMTKLKADALTEPGRYSDGKVAGLYLQVTIGRNGDVNRSWTLRYKCAGKSREAGLGPYPGIGIAEARGAAGDALALLRAGRDPLAEKAKNTADTMSTKTFAQAADDFLDHLCAQKSQTKFPSVTARAWRSTLARFVLPKIGELDCKDIKHVHVAGVLKEILKGSGRHSVASKVRSRLERILDYSASHGWRDADAPNPARPALLKDVIGGKPPTKHHAAPALADAPTLYRIVRDADGTIFRCAEFTILTACRISEVTKARWEDVDLVAGTFTVPAGRSKVNRDHVIPLSGRARAILQIQMTRRTGDTVFPNASGSPFERTSVVRALRRIGVGYTIHGWRSVFRDCAADELGADDTIAEFALAHIKGGVEGAYRRQTALAKRALLMQAWAGWLAGEPVLTGDNVVPLRATA
jgi:integrase